MGMRQESSPAAEEAGEAESLLSAVIEMLLQDLSGAAALR